MGLAMEDAKIEDLVEKWLISTFDHKKLANILMKTIVETVEKTLTQKTVNYYIRQAVSDSMSKILASDQVKSIIAKRVQEKITPDMIDAEAIRGAEKIARVLLEASRYA